MTRRVLVIPAAGAGSRLGEGVAKLLVPVAGVPMIDRLRQLYAETVAEIVLIVHPSFAARVRQHVSGWSLPVSCAVQERPTGMLDAIMLAGEAVRAARPDSVWITWCDQVAVHPATVQRLAECTAVDDASALAMPTVTKRAPYIHLARDAAGRIAQVLHRREGDRMPEVGESDIGLFALSRFAYADLLPHYAAEAAIGVGTGERNFLPFIPWLASAGHQVVTFPAVDDIEAVGVNTPAELELVERYLARRDGSGA
jgi:bifunctional UDP-N-acetylglucosamine pyrophosphorylase/glucosamine-1-phosphate N-acetyltransferase